MSFPLAAGLTYLCEPPELPPELPDELELDDVDELELETLALEVDELLLPPPLECELPPPELEPPPL